MLTCVPVPSLAAVRSVPVLTIRGGGAADSLAVAEASGVGVPPTEQQEVLEKLVRASGLPRQPVRRRLTRLGRSRVMLTWEQGAKSPSDWSDLA